MGLLSCVSLCKTFFFLNEYFISLIRTVDFDCLSTVSQVRKHSAVCLSHCGPPSCTLKAAESWQSKTCILRVTKRDMKLMKTASTIYMHVRWSVNIVRFIYHLEWVVDFVPCLELRSRIAIAWNARCFAWQEDPMWTNAWTITHVICA